MTEDELADERAALADAKSALVESAATEVVSIGRLLFKDGEPSGPELQRRYRFYKRLEAALALSGRKPIGEVVPMAAVQPDVQALFVGLDAVAVGLDLVHPAVGYIPSPCWPATRCQAVGEFQ